MHDFTLAAIAQNLRKKVYSAEELTKTFLKRIQELDPAINSFITVTAETALIAARNADQQLQQGTATALTGIPVAYKDNFCTQGIKTTCASKLLQNFYPKHDATTVALLQKAGAIICGKTNMDEFAMGSSNENSFFGRAKNPWDITRVPGGSSGGSAAAVVARLIPFALGTDTGGSTRQPAALCGVCGLKPTFGRISKHGIIPLAISLDHVGILATSAEDLAIILPEISGFDPQDATTLDVKIPDYYSELNTSLHGLKIGLPKEYFNVTIDHNVTTALQAAIALFEANGAKIIEINLPHSEIAVPTYCAIADAECTTNFKNFGNFDVAARSTGFGDEVKRRILAGTFLQSTETIAKYLIPAQKVRRLISNDFAAAFQQVDIILGPTTPSTAFKANAVNSDPIKMYWSDMFTVAASLAGLPALSIPIGFAQNLPIGMQLIGKHFAEGKILNVAHQYQQLTDWHVKASYT